MLRAAVTALVLAAGGTACNAPAPPPASAPAPAPAVAPTPVRAEAVARSHPLCDAAAGALADLQAQAGDVAIAYAGGPLQQWVVASDAATGRQDDAAITASLRDTSAAGIAHTRARLEAALGQWMRHQLKGAAGTGEGQGVMWAAARCTWELGLRPLAADVTSTDPGLAEEVDDALAAGALALASGDPAAIDRALLPGHELVEKTWYRIAHRRLLAAARQARGADDAVAAARARGIFEALRDGLKDRNTPGIAVIDAALAGPPAQLDPDRIEREIALALVKRARKYCDEALTPAAKGPLGSPAALATVAEGLAYTRVVLPDMSQKLGGDGFDADAHVALWRAYGEAVADADAAEAQTASADLVQWNCAYQRALGIRECTSTVDEAALVPH